MPPVPAVGSYSVRTMPASVRAASLLCKEKVDQQLDRVPGGVVVTGGLVRGFVELPDDVLEGVTHIGVRHLVRVQVYGPERLNDLTEETRLVQSEDLFLKVEVFEHVDVGGEPVDEIDQVVREPIGVGQQVGERVIRGIVERPPGGLGDLDLEPVWIVILLGQLPHGVAIGLKHAIQASQDRERKNHIAVLVGAIGAAELIGDRPDEASERAHTSPLDRRRAIVA